MMNENSDQTQLLPIAALSDNYIWLIHRNGHAAVVDPGEAEPVRRVLQALELTLDAILLTHHHGDHVGGRSEEHTSELQSLMRTSYAVFCLKKKNNKQTTR